MAYYFELMTDGKQPPSATDGGLIKTELETIGKQRQPGTTGQGFYRGFKAIWESDMNNKKLIENHYGNDWIKIVTDLSENKEDITDYIKKNYSE